MWVMFEYHALRDIVLQKAAPFPLGLDVALATALLREQALYCLAVFRVNRRLVAGEGPGKEEFS